MESKAMSVLYPLKFVPIFKQMIWGSETWGLSGVKGSESVVSNGDLRGKMISEIIREYREQLVGGKNYHRFGDEFPLLIKFIDASLDLSVQVHPNDELARMRHGKRGKSEMWYVTGARPGARLHAGFSCSLSPDEYERKVADGTIADALAEYEVGEGDVFYLPAGRVHSLGAGTSVAEIQETSDVTYRIFDFNRLGLDGKPRELHTALAKDAIDFTVLRDYRTHYQLSKNEEMLLVRCPHFTTVLYDIDECVSKDISSLDSFLAVMCTEGEGTVSDSQGNRAGVRAGETVLLPACSGIVTFAPSHQMKLLASYV